MPKEAKASQVKAPYSELQEDSSFIKVFISTFSTVFLVELGDKTQIATLLLSAQSGKPLLIFIGSSTALICSSLVGVLIGRWIAQSLPPQRFKVAAGLLMLALGTWLCIQTSIPLATGESVGGTEITLISTFTTVFLAELGDKTQIATVAISGSSNRTLAVFIGSSSALVLASILGVIAGGSIAAILPGTLLKVIASIGLIVIGIKLLWPDSASQFDLKS